ncbi:MAG: hypothetical protein M3033_04190 [Acidobacteriota bacterium]|nr:hypothetical protein [Acidobacteriota bacterium]
MLFLIVVLSATIFSQSDKNKDVNPFRRVESSSALANNAAFPRKAFDGDDYAVTVTTAANGNLGVRIHEALTTAKTQMAQCIVKVEPSAQVISTQIIVPENCTLQFLAGTFNFAVDGAAILLKSKSSLRGISKELTVLKENHIGKNVRSTVRSYGIRQYPFEGTDEGLYLSDFQINGDGITLNYDAAYTTIALGNVKRTLVERVYLKSTNTLGLNVGGANLSGDTNDFYADTVTVQDCLFEGVATNNLNIVNARNVIFTRNTILKPGKMTASGFVANAHGIDIETHHRWDRLENLIISYNIFDFRGSAGESVGNIGHGIAGNNGDGSRYVGLINISNNVFIGGDVHKFTDANKNGFYDSGETWNPVNNMACGIFIANNFQDVSITNNQIRRVSQAGIYLGGVWRAYVSGNAIQNNGGSVSAIILDSTKYSVVRDNYTSYLKSNDYGVKSDTENWGATNTAISETNDSDYNKFYNNNGFSAPSLIGSNSENGDLNIVGKAKQVFGGGESAIASGGVKIIPTVLNITDRLNLTVTEGIYSAFNKTNTTQTVNLADSSFVAGNHYQVIKLDANAGLLRISVPGGKFLVWNGSYNTKGFFQTTQAGATIKLTCLDADTCVVTEQTMNWSFVTN